MQFASPLRLAWLLAFSVALLAAPQMTASADEPAPPFAEAIERSAITTEKLESLPDDSLLIGNGDLNGLVHTEGGRLQMIVTKNDLWDARLETALDPPIPTLELIKERVGQSDRPLPDRSFVLPEDSDWQGPDSYHAHPYPCPRICARLRLVGQPGKPLWKQIRRQGSVNQFDPAESGGAVMRIEGKPEASNGYRYGPLGKAGRGFSKLRVQLSGTENAQYFIDLVDAEGAPVLHTGWQETPTESEQVEYALTEDMTVDGVILYTWTEDGKPAENRFEKVVLEGPDGLLEIPLTAEAMIPAKRPGKLDIRRAVVVSPDPKNPNEETVLRVLADRNVVLIRSAQPLEFVAAPATDAPEAELGTEAQVQWLTQTIPGDLDWPGMGFAMAMARRGDWTAVAVVTSREADDPRRAAIDLAKSTTAVEPEELIAVHEAAWDRFWARSGLLLDDPYLTSTWYRNLYFFRCVTKKGAISPGLFASLINSYPAWHGDYHTNYNIQQTFWTAFAANHPELAEPYDRLIREYLPRARWLCREIFATEGAYYPHVLFAYEPREPAKCKSPNGRQYIHHVWGYTLGVAGFSVQPVWWHYKYEPSRQLLEDVAYPVVRDVAQFQAAFIEKCPGDQRVVLGPSVSPEHWGWTPRFQYNRNGTFDTAMFRYIFEAAIEGAETLQRDAELVERWRKAMRRLPDYPLHGETDPVVVDMQGAPPINYNIAVPAVPVFPGDVVTWLSPQPQKELFTRTIEGLHWNGNNSTIILGVARARLDMPGTYQWIRDELAARQRPNGTLTLNRNEPRYRFNEFGHYTEQFGATMAISELLVQSVGDVIRVFPAWPPEKSAQFENLRTQGGFLVSASMKDGVIDRLEIVSTAGQESLARDTRSPVGRNRGRSPDRRSRHSDDRYPARATLRVSPGRLSARQRCCRGLSSPFSRRPVRSATRPTAAWARGVRRSRRDSRPRRRELRRRPVPRFRPGNPRRLPAESPGVRQGPTPPEAPGGRSSRSCNRRAPARSRPEACFGPRCRDRRRSSPRSPDRRR